MRLSNSGLAQLKRLEGKRLVAYGDTGGTLTIGYGHTGSDVRAGQVINDIEAETLLSSDVMVAEQGVTRLVTVPLNQNQFDALVIFVFNIGYPRFQNSTLLSLLNKGKYEAVPAQMSRWNKVTRDGKLVVDPGLVNRRNAEIGLWVKSTVEQDIHQGTTPSPVVERALMRTKTMLGVVATALGTLFTGLLQTDFVSAAAAVEQYADILPYARMFSFVLTATGLVASAYGRAHVRTQTGA